MPSRRQQHVNLIRILMPYICAVPVMSLGYGYQKEPRHWPSVSLHPGVIIISSTLEQVLSAGLGSSGLVMLKAHATFKVTGTFICLFRYSWQHFLMWDIFYSSKFISFALKCKINVVKDSWIPSEKCISSKVVLLKKREGS